MEENYVSAANENNKDVEMLAGIKKAPKFTAKDSRYALATLIIGFIFINFILVANLSLSATVFSLVLIAFSLAFLRGNNIKQTKTTILYLGIAIISAIYFFISANPMLKFFNCFFFGLVFAYWISLSCKQGFEKGLSVYTPGELFKTIVATPFSNLTLLPKAVLTLVNKEGKGKNITLCITGIIIAAPLTIIVISLLSSADSAFQALFKVIYDNLLANSIKYIFQFIVGIPIAIYVFGLLFAYAKNYNTGKITKQSIDKASENAKSVPLILICSALTPLCLTYIIYFLAQANYFLSAFRQVLPSGFSFAEYARRGFFELTAVSFINLGVICLSLLLAQRTGKNKILKAYIISLCGFTMLLIITAISKMLMYISIYGLTPLRVYTTWFMLLLFLIFSFLIIKQFSPKFRSSGWIARSFIVMFLLLTFSNTDALIAKYNIERYLNGSLKEVDFVVINDLSDSALPYVGKLCDSEDPEISQKASEWLSLRKESASARNNWKELNLPQIYSVQEFKANSD